MALHDRGWFGLVRRILAGWIPGAWVVAAAWVPAGGVVRGMPLTQGEPPSDLGAPGSGEGTLGVPESPAPGPATPSVEPKGLANGDCEEGIEWIDPWVRGFPMASAGPVAWTSLRDLGESHGSGLRWCLDPDGSASRGRVLGVSVPASSMAPGDGDRRVGWTQGVRVDGLDAATLLLRFDMRAVRMHPAAMACVRVQVLGDEGEVLSTAWSERSIGGHPWVRREVLAELPGGAVEARIELYLVGVGEVYFDRLRLGPSERSVGKHRPYRGGYEGLARGAAGDIRWEADLPSALERAAREHKPVLVYVRSIDHPDGLSSARTSITADRVPLSDDGLRKDLLMRAGPLSDPDVRALVQERFVPVVVTYELLRHGRGGAADDPLLALGHRARDVVAPAFLVLDPRGATVHRMHRFGALSGSRLDMELRWALVRSGVRPRLSQDVNVLFRGGELGAVLALLGARQDAEARRMRARVLLRQGFPSACLDLLVGLGDGESMHLRGRAHLGEGRFGEAERAFGSAALLGGLRRPQHNAYLGAWSLARLGRWEQASLGFDRLVGRGPVGRRAAACLLPQGPFLWLAGSEAIPRGGAPLGSGDTGTPSAQGLDPRRSLGFLLGCQALDGSFGSHEGSLHSGPDRPAITALVGLALGALREELGGSDRAPIDAALVAAETYLLRWSEFAPAEGSSGLSLQAPFVLEFLLDRGRREAAERLVEALAEGQGSGGGWSHYGRGEVEAFTTGLVLRALHRASEEGLPVPGAVFRRGARALERLRDAEGCFAYSDRPGRSWSQTPVGGLGRDVLCAEALLICLEHGAEGPGPSDLARHERARRGFDRAMLRFLDMHPLLGEATKRWADYFDTRGLASYFFFSGHHSAMRASSRWDLAGREELRRRIRGAVWAAREHDGTWVDHIALGRAYGTAMAWILLLEE